MSERDVRERLRLCNLSERFADDEFEAYRDDVSFLFEQLEVERERSAKLIERLKRFANGFAKTDLLLSAEIAVILNRLIKVYEAKADE